MIDTTLGEIYRVYDRQKNEFVLTPRETKQEAVDDADSLAGLDHFTGTIEVHEVDDDDSSLLSAVVVYRRRA